MKEKNSLYLVNQAKEFYKNTRYVPTNYDYLFHTAYFVSPVTIRRHYGSWEKFIDKAFSHIQMDYQNRMFYGGYGMMYKPALSQVLEPDIWINNKSWNILGNLTYEDIEPKVAWVVKKRWYDIIEVILDIFDIITFQIVPATKHGLLPYAIVNGTYMLCSFDTPHITNHYKRTNNLVKKANRKELTIININGTKKNHLKNAIKEELI